ncbi:unnamed protein product [Thlaspi arvense]|uniref:Uncharacterized protein n=1 Tax=Thlaspi arvense TaxID=13288 RepID=A0AAU9R6C2_THLAR|nr:unnamed protein product [Thlaspi arvense]
MDSHKTVAFPPLISIMILLIILESTTTIYARELRPSDHGLEDYYDPGESSSEMTSFFGPPSSNELTSTSSPSGSTLPSAVKSPMKSSKGRNDHVMTHVLVIGSLVCGLSGVALMVASALIYFLGYPKLQNSSINCELVHTNDTK